MTELTQSLADLGDAGRDLRIYFISVDPERDTPELMREYLSSFDPRIVGLSGTASEIEAVAKQYGAFYQKVPTKDGDYTMNHTAVVYLMDRHGKFLDVLSYEEPHATQVEKLTALLKHG